MECASESHLHNSTDCTLDKLVFAVGGRSAVSGMIPDLRPRE